MRVLFTAVAACALALVAAPASASCCQLDPIVIDVGWDCVTEPCNSPEPIVICPPVVCES